MLFVGVRCFVYFILGFVGPWRPYVFFVLLLSLVLFGILFMLLLALLFIHFVVANVFNVLALQLPPYLLPLGSWFCFVSYLLFCQVCVVLRTSCVSTNLYLSSYLDLFCVPFCVPLCSGVQFYWLSASVQVIVWVLHVRVTAVVALWVALHHFYGSLVSQLLRLFGFLYFLLLPARVSVP